MTVEQLKVKLSQGIVEFSYTKKDGSIREARGTTNINILREHSAEPKGTTEYQLNNQVIRYFDLDSEGWRSFCINNLIS